MKKWYIRVDSQNVIKDVISFPFDDYQEIELQDLPDGIAGRWFKYEGGQVVEFPELKPAYDSAEIEKVKLENEPMKRENEVLKNQLAQLSVDLQSFMDFYFDQ